MCGRFTLTVSLEKLCERFKVAPPDKVLFPLPKYNVVPTQMMPVITNEDDRKLKYFRWGLLPPWAQDKNEGAKMINARLETIKEKKTYAMFFNKKRCLVPAD